jgi:hypothetical protein
MIPSEEIKPKMKFIEDNIVHIDNFENKKQMVKTLAEIEIDR